MLVVVATTVGVVGVVGVSLKNASFSGAPMGGENDTNHLENNFLHFPIENKALQDASFHR